MIANEYTYNKDDILNGNIKNNINAIVYANSENEAKQLLKTHPVYDKNIKEIIKDLNGEDDNYIKFIKNMDIVEYLFDNEGLSELYGSIILVKDKDLHWFE